MTRRTLAGLLAGTIAAISIAACDDGWGHGRSYGYGPYGTYSCQQYTSCASCTPVLGCGWCAFPTGGACLSAPNECGARAFSWTWDLDGCGSIRDGGALGSSDTGTADARTRADGGNIGTPGDGASDR